MFLAVSSANLHETFGVVNKFIWKSVLGTILCDFWWKRTCAGHRDRLWDNERKTDTFNSTFLCYRYSPKAWISSTRQNITGQLPLSAYGKTCQGERMRQIPGATTHKQLRTRDKVCSKTHICALHVSTACTCEEEYEDEAIGSTKFAINSKRRKLQSRLGRIIITIFK